MIQPKKVLILTGKAGQGHLSVAKALDFWLTSWGYNPTIFDVLPAYNGRINEILYKSPESYKSIFKATNNIRLAKLMVKQVSPQADKAADKYLPDVAKYDLVISTHPLVHPGYGKRRAMVFLDPVVHAIYCVAPKLEYYLSFWVSGLKECRKSGLASDDVWYLGPLVRGAFYQVGARIRKSQDKAIYKKLVGISPEQKIILVVAGGKWIYRAKDYLEDIKREFDGKNSVFVFICGKNVSFYKKYSKKYRRLGLFKFLAWLDEADMANWLGAADGVLALSIAQMSTEAGLCRTPIYIADYIPGQEEGYLDLLIKNGAGVKLTGAPAQKIRKFKKLFEAAGVNGAKLSSWQRKLLLAPRSWQTAIGKIMATEGSVTVAKKEPIWKRIVGRLTRG